MGVTGLWSILAPSAKEVSLSTISGQKVAIDLSGWIVDSQTCGISSSVVKPYLRNLFFRTTYLLDLGIIPIFVLDGEAPLLKSNTLKDRNAKRFNKPSSGDGRKRRLLSGLAKRCREFLEAMGVCCLQAPGEAEATCGWLSREKVVAGVITEDSDCLLYGATTVYKDFSVSAGQTNLIVYEAEEIRSKLGYDRRSLIALALLLGCDYTDGVPGVGIQGATKFVKTSSGEEILEKMNSWIDEDCDRIITAKSPHCATCGHPGSKRQHETKGCHLCITLKNCREMAADFECSCDWHVEMRSCSELVAEQQVREKAVKALGFPFLDVQNEFLNPGGIRVHKQDLNWKEPNLEKLFDLMTRELGWESDYCFEKLVPLYTRWCALNNSGLHPRKIVKPRRVRFVECYEVEWEKIGIFLNWDKQPVSTIPKEILKAAYPELVEEFELSKKKPRKKVISTKVKTPKLRKNIGKIKRISAYFRKNESISEKVSLSIGKSEDLCAELTLSLKKCSLGPSGRQKERPRRRKALSPKTCDGKHGEGYGTNDKAPESSAKKLPNASEDLGDSSLEIMSLSNDNFFERDSLSTQSLLETTTLEDQSIIIESIISRKTARPQKIISSPNAVSTPNERGTFPRREICNNIISGSPLIPRDPNAMTTVTRTFVTPAKPRFSLSFGNLISPEDKENSGHSGSFEKSADSTFEFESPLPLRERLLSKK